MARKTLKSRIKYRIIRSRDSVFLISDFTDLSSPHQVSRALAALQKEKCVLRISVGVYARLIVSPFSKILLPEKPLPDLARDALIKMGIEVVPTTGLLEYNANKTTQIPLGRQIAVKNSRTKRQFKKDSWVIKYEYQ